MSVLVWEGATYDDSSRIVTFPDGTTRPYTAAENARIDADSTFQTLKSRTDAALATNLTDQAQCDTIINTANPTNNQVISAVKELARQSKTQSQQLNALIRMLLHELDSST